MKCPDVERVVPEFLEGAPDGPFRHALQADFEAHLKSCRACADLVSDLKLISSEARQLAATEEPSPRLWLRIAAQLRAEGLSRSRNSAPARPFPVPTSSRRRWNGRVVAGANCGCCAGGGVLRRESQATSARSRTASSCASGSFPGEGDPRSKDREASPAAPAPAPQQLQLRYPYGHSGIGSGAKGHEGNGRTRRWNQPKRGRSAVSECSFHVRPCDAGHV